MTVSSKIQEVGASSANIKSGSEKKCFILLPPLLFIFAGKSSRGCQLTFSNVTFFYITSISSLYDVVFAFGIYAVFKIDLSNCLIQHLGVFITSNNSSIAPTELRLPPDTELGFCPAICVSTMPAYLQSISWVFLFNSRSLQLRAGKLTTFSSS